LRSYISRASFYLRSSANLFVSSCIYSLALLSSYFFAYSSFLRLSSFCFLNFSSASLRYFSSISLCYFSPSYLILFSFSSFNLFYLSILFFKLVKVFLFRFLLFSCKINSYLFVFDNRFCCECFCYFRKYWYKWLLFCERFNLLLFFWRFSLLYLLFLCNWSDWLLFNNWLLLNNNSRSSLDNWWFLSFFLLTS
jgi:hypothetical protein